MQRGAKSCCERVIFYSVADHFPSKAAIKTDFIEARKGCLAKGNHHFSSFALTSASLEVTSPARRWSRLPTASFRDFRRYNKAVDGFAGSQKQAVEEANRWTCNLVFWFFLRLDLQCEAAPLESRGEKQAERAPLLRNPSFQTDFLVTRRLFRRRELKATRIFNGKEAQQLRWKQLNTKNTERGAQTNQQRPSLGKPSLRCRGCLNGN